jgi:hypothetical protein
VAHTQGRIEALGALLEPGFFRDLVLEALEVRP